MFFGILTTRRVNLLMQPRKVSAPAFLARAALAFFTSWAVLFLLLLGAYALPGAPVRQNISKAKRKTTAWLKPKGRTAFVISFPNGLTARPTKT